ncbi:MAG: hypothetical protein M1833_000751 [Piccolia ochrophora]|nr:MAG: hypothetical protein M1833_000751 [Piccolia ochrophora]
MTKLVLWTSNVLNDGPSVIRKQHIEKSNYELTTSLRTHFRDSQEDATYNSSTTRNGSSVTNGTRHRPTLSSWTAREGATLYIPTKDWSANGLTEERSQYDITVKLFFLPNIPTSRRATQAREALALVLKELKVESVDLLIASYPGVSFVADDEDAQDKRHGCSESIAAYSAPPPKSDPSTEAEDVPTMIETWRSLEKLHAQGVIGKLGVCEFGSQRLAHFIKQAHVRPSVNQINKEGIELLTHNDCTDILPKGTVRELLGQSEKGVGVLAESGEDEGQGLKGDVEPQFVIKYTAVVKDRGVVENKGYYAVADLND